jgi:hypothetical protein
VGNGEQREGGLACECAEREHQAGLRDPAAGPLDPGRTRRHDRGRDDHPAAERPPFEQRSRERQYHRHAAHDHSDGGRVGLANALDHEQVEENEPGGGEGEEPEGLAPVEPRKAAPGDGQQHEAGSRVAERLPGGERIALDEVGGGDQRAHQGEGAGGEQRSFERR